MLFGQGRFQLRTDGFKALNLVEVIEICAVPADELRKHKLSVCETGRFLAFAASDFVIVAADDDCLVCESVSCRFGDHRHIVGGESHIDRPASGKMEACASGKAFTDGYRLFRLPQNDEPAV